MEMELAISLHVKIDGSGANLNEICAAVQETIRGELSVRVTEEIIEGLQEDVRERLCTSSGREAKKGLGSHEKKGEAGRRCRIRTFVKQGHRRESRKVKTDVGEISFEVGYVQCVECEKKFTPILDVLEIEAREKHSGGLERVASEAVMKTSYQRGEEEIVGRGAAPVAKSSAHRWVVGRELPQSRVSAIDSGMADGTKFKKWPGQRGELRIMIGLEKGQKVRPVGVWAGTSWEQIGKEVREILRTGKEDAVQLKLFAEDGEVGIDQHLATVADKGQRCIWHLPRDLGYAMWEDKAPLADRRQKSGKLAGLVGIEIPAQDWEEIRALDKAKLKEQVQKSETEIQKMIGEFREKGYAKAVTYLENACGKIFSHVHLWLETGIVSPRTTSILENIMRELGRRVKKLGWNWSDEGVEQMAKMVMMRRYDREEWENYWRKELGLRDRCTIIIKEIHRHVA